MVCRGDVPFASRAEILTEAAKDLAKVLDDALTTVATPDDFGSEWLEVYRGNPLLPVYVMVDYIGNVLHVRRNAETFSTERFTVTYLPSWFFAVLESVPARRLARTRTGTYVETIAAQCSDRATSMPLRIDVTVEWRTNTKIVLIPPDTQPLPGAKTSFAVLPQVVYDLRPSRGSLALRENANPELVAQQAARKEGLAEASIERVHWTAPSLRISAAPGVSVDTRELLPVLNTEFDPWSLDWSGGLAALKSSPFWGWFVMNAAYCADDAAKSGVSVQVTSQQALQLELERLQNPEALPPVGAPRRSAGLSEMDLLAGDWGMGMHIEEVTRPDGADVLLLTTRASATLLRSRADPVRALLAGLDPYVAGVRGELPPDTPIPVRIRVDPQSPHDRYAYSVTFLNNRKPVAASWLAGDQGPFFRLSVIRTSKVRVDAGLFFVDSTVPQMLKSIVDFREKVVSFGEVPLAITDDGASLDCVELRSRPLTFEEAADLTMLVIGSIPFPPCQVVSDLNDYATILRYFHDGKDTIGRDMSGWEAAATFAGLLLPEVLESVAKHAVRLVTAGDGPAKRILAALAKVSPAKLGAVSTPLLKDVAP